MRMTVHTPSHDAPYSHENRYGSLEFTIEEAVVSIHGDSYEIRGNMVMSNGNVSYAPHAVEYRGSLRKISQAAGFQVGLNQQEPISAIFILRTTIMAKVVEIVLHNPFMYMYLDKSKEQGSRGVVLLRSEALPPLSIEEAEEVS